MHAVSEAGQARWVMVGAQAGRGLDVATMSLSLVPRSTGHTHVHRGFADMHAAAEAGRLLAVGVLLHVCRAVVVCCHHANPCLCAGTGALMQALCTVSPVISQPVNHSSALSEQLLCCACRCARTAMLSCPRTLRGATRQTSRRVGTSLLSISSCVAGGWRVHQLNSLLRCCCSLSCNECIQALIQLENKLQGVCGGVRRSWW